MKNSLFKHFKGDFFGGITAGIVALPLALAFGVTSGLGPDAGLYGAIFIGIFAALFGGTPTQISGPTAPMTAVSLLVISGIVAANDGDVSKALPIILGVFLLAGLIQIALGFAGVGKYIRYIPYPVVSGFMTAIGVIIIITQLLPILGYYPKEDSAYVASFKAQAEEVLLEKILKEEAGEGYLVLEDFSETQRRAAKVSQEDVLNEAKILAKDHAKSVWGAAIPAENTLIETYLTSRNITVACPDSLRFHQNLRHKDSEYFPAMVGEITSSLDNTFQGVHRTFLQRDGSGKAPLKEPKIMLGQASGGVVKLCEATETVALAEGIETALSVAQMTENPVWAALSAGNLKSLLLPKHILSVDIFADGDEAGKDAATTAARRLSIEGRSVRIIAAPDGQDFNNLLCAIENDDATRSPEQLIKRLIEDAAVINCPLDDLLERLEESKGAAFEPDVLDSLNYLKTNDFPKFENLRTKIKKSGCRVGELDRRMKTRDPSASDNETDIDKVVACASDAELFSDNNKRAYANYIVKGAKHTAPLGSRAFQLWVTQKFLGENGSAPRPETLRAAVNTLEAKALFGDKKMPVNYRLGMQENIIHLDLCLYSPIL